MKTALTIAGSDPSGGAGIQADLKTMLASGVYGMSAITALTVQNTVGVTDILEVDSDFLGAQLDSIFTDIPPDGVKIGMVASSKLIRTIAGKLKEYQADNVVVDPVMVSTSGSRLMAEEAVETLKSTLLPMATVLTPNIPEAEVLAEMTIKTKNDMVLAAETISRRYHCAVLCKGGHLGHSADDYLYCEGIRRWFPGKRIDNSNTHGTGCTLSSAIVAHLARGCTLEIAVERAKAYVTGALSAMLDLGKGRGPLNHGFNLQKRDVR